MNILETFFTKIYKSIDLRWNKLINARTNHIPDEEVNDKPDAPNYDGEIIINRKYVDDKTTFDTEKVNKYGKPFLQWWMDNISGKSFKEVLDDLLFPRLFPRYVNPEFYDVYFEFEDVYKNGNKHMLFYGQRIKGRLHFKTTESDRESNVTTVLRINYTGNIFPEVTFTSATTGLESYIDFEFNFIDTVMNVTLEKQFLAAPIKQDTYGDDSIPDDFKTNYLLTKNITDLLYQKEICLFSPCYKLVTNYDNDGNPQGNGITETFNSPAINKDKLTGTYGFTIGDKFLITGNQESELYLLLPVETTETKNIMNFNNSRYFFELYRGDLLIDKVEIPKDSLLRGNITQKFCPVKYHNSSNDITKMIECIYHFGIYTEDMFGRIVIENKNNKDYMLS